MAGQKFLQHDGNGGLKEVVATQTGGSGNEAKIPALDANGRLDVGMMPAGIGADTSSVEASENLVAGDFVNIYSASGAKCRKADAATSGKRAHGFVVEAVASGQMAKVYREGANGQVSGLTPGAEVFLSTVAGVATETAPSASGNIVQPIGVAVSATEVNVEFGAPVEIA